MKPAVLLAMADGAGRIARSLVERAGVQILAATQSAGQALTAAGIPHHRLEEFLTEGVAERVRHQAAKRLQAVSAALNGSEMRRQWPQFDDVTWRSLCLKVGNVLAAHLTATILLVEQVRRCVQGVDLRLVLVSEEESPESRTIIHAARRFGVPSLHICCTGQPVRPSANGGMLADRMFTLPGDRWEQACDAALEMVENWYKYVRPAERFPEYESALARCLPEEVRTVLVVGVAALYVADAMAGINPAVSVTTASTCEGWVGTQPKAVVLSDPLPPTSAAEKLLRAGRSLVGDGGIILAVFENGGSVEAFEAFDRGVWTPPRQHSLSPTAVGQFSRTGMEIILSRADLEPQRVAEVHEFGADGPSTPAGAAQPHANGCHDESVLAWVAVSRPRKAGLSPFGQARLERRRRADARNKQGENLFRQGDFLGAISEFGAAINEWNEEAVYFNNLGAALYALGHHEEAWHRTLEALHLDPYLQSARDNLRALANSLGRAQQAEEILNLFGTSH